MFDGKNGAEEGRGENQLRLCNTTIQDSAEQVSGWSTSVAFRMRGICKTGGGRVSWTSPGGIFEIFVLHTLRGRVRKSFVASWFFCARLPNTGQRLFCQSPSLCKANERWNAANFFPRSALGQVGRRAGAKQLKQRRFRDSSPQFPAFNIRTRIRLSLQRHEVRKDRLC